MFTKNEAKLLRQEFWTSFGKSFPTEWVLYNTNVKGLSFKFHFDTKKALVALDLEDDLDNRINYWEKLESLKSILRDEYLPDVVFEEESSTKSGVKMRKVRRKYLVNAQSVTASEALVYEFLNERRLRVPER